MSYHFVRIDQNNAKAYQDFCQPEQLEAALEAGKLGRAAGMTDEEGTPIGAAIGLLEPDAMWITSIFVAQEARGSGAGTMLLNGMIALAIRAGRRAVYLEYPQELDPSLEFFLLSRDFDIDADQMTFTIPLPQLKAALDRLTRHKPAGSILPLDQLPVEQRLEWESRIGKTIPRMTDPASLPGKPYGPACLALSQEGRVVGHTACSLSADGSSAVLGAIYLQPSAADEDGMALLCAALDALCGSGAEEFAFAAVSQAEIQLMEYLGETLELTWQTAVTHTALLVRQDPELLASQDPRELTWTELMPRFNGLMQLLRSLELEPRLVLDEEDGPAVELESEGQLLRLTYIRLGDASTDRFLLSAKLELPVPEKEGPFPPAQLCQLANAGSLGPIAEFLPDRDRFLLRATLPEVGPMPKPETLSLFLDLIWDSAALLLSDQVS